VTRVEAMLWVSAMWRRGLSMIHCWFQRSNLQRRARQILQGWPKGTHWGLPWCDWRNWYGAGPKPSSGWNGGYRVCGLRSCSQRSITGSMIFVGHSPPPVFYSSKRQGAVGTSTYWAEFCSM
jgi:hypothetical protein